MIWPASLSAANPLTAFTHDGAIRISPLSDLHGFLDVVGFNQFTSANRAAITSPVRVPIALAERYPSAPQSLLTPLDEHDLENELDHINPPLHGIEWIRTASVRLAQGKTLRYAFSCQSFERAAANREALHVMYVQLFGSNPNTGAHRPALTVVSERTRIMLRLIICAVAIGCPVFEVHAQVSVPSTGWERPNVQSIGAGNAAGVLQYCIKKQLVSSVSAEVVIEELTRKRHVTHSPDFKAGESGEILGKHHFSIGRAPGFIQSEACDSVLRRAKQFPVTP